MDVHEIAISQKSGFKQKYIPDNHLVEGTIFIQRGDYIYIYYNIYNREALYLYANLIKVLSKLVNTVEMYNYTKIKV